jgi:hypothetical protein
MMPSLVKAAYCALVHGTGSFVHDDDIVTNRWLTHTLAPIAYCPQSLSLEHLLVANTSALEYSAATAQVLDAVSVLLGVPTDTDESLVGAVQLAEDTTASLLREVLGNELAKSMGSEGDSMQRWLRQVLLETATSRDVRVKAARILMALNAGSDSEADLNAKLHAALLSMLPDALGNGTGSSPAEWFAVLVQTAKSTAQVRDICEGVGHCIRCGNDTGLLHLKDVVLSP